MNPGIKDLFIGVVHLFVIFIPGAFVLLTIGYALRGADPAFPSQLAELGLSSAGASLLFIALSYVAGHLVSLVASRIEDKVKIARRLEEKDGELMSLRTVAHGICQDRLTKITIRKKKPRRWCATLAKIDNDSFRTEIEAKDADRRFFRNFLLVLLGPFVITAFQVVYLVVNSEASDNSMMINRALGALALVLVLIFLSALRYLDQDKKFSQTVFEAVIALDSKRSDEAEPGESGENRARG